MKQTFQNWYISKKKVLSTLNLDNSAISLPLTPVGTLDRPFTKTSLYLLLTAN